MDRLRELLRDKPHLTLSVPTILFFIQFLMSLADAIRTGTFNHNTISQLLSSADGFETVMLFMIMMALKGKTK